MITSTETHEQSASELMGPGAVSQIAREFAEVIRSEGNIGVVFGAPMALENHVIIPVARVEIGFGGGVGGNVDTNPNGKANGDGIARHLGTLARVVRRGFGAGGGGGIKVTPVGFIHEDGESVRYQVIQSESK
jgi:uncharacterized spore protein YtfJ